MPSPPLFPPADRPFAEAISRLASANPFLPERIDAERAALGPDFVDAGPVWSLRADRPAASANLPRIARRLGPFVERLRDRLAAGAAASDADRALYEDVALFFLFDRYDERLQTLIDGGGTPRVDFYTDFSREHDHLFRLPGSPVQPPAPAHLFACFFQIRRAFHYLYAHLLGASLPAARLRAATWQSIFTHDLRRYIRSLHARMHEIPTLVTGPTGTGKELVARAIGLSRYVPFDAGAQRFESDHAEDFHPLNISALAPALVESELFGHRRGAFTGSVEDRQGWLENCKPGGTVFLDEIGELDTAIQVKLLRVLQTRTFQRAGESKDRSFAGKLVAATHRDLAERMRSGAFRADLYYRICADHITTPSLRAQLDDAPGERRHLVRFIAAKVAGPEEAEVLTGEVEAWIDGHLPPDYAWPGNVRELEQCVRSVLVRSAYEPPSSPASLRGVDLGRDFVEGRLSADEALRYYTTVVYARTGSYAETGRRLGIDYRTVAGQLDHDLLERLTKRRPEPPPSVPPRSRRNPRARRPRG